MQSKGFYKLHANPIEDTQKNISELQGKNTPKRLLRS